MLLFVARRLFQQSDASGRVSKPAIRIATAGVAVGIAVMLMSMAVALGFQDEVRGKVTGFGSHLQVLNYQTLSSMESCPLTFDDETLAIIDTTRGVAHWQRYCDKVGMLKTAENFHGMQFRGVGQEYDTDFLRRHLLQGEIPLFSDTANSQKVLLSEQVARELGLKVGDRVYAYFFDKSVRARRLTVSGIYRTNMVDFDKAFAFTDLHAVQTLLGWDDGQYSGVEVKVKDFERLEEVQDALVKNFKLRQDPYGAFYSVLSIQQLYPQVFTWLSLLDMDVWVILILMACVAGFTMVSGLLIIILERTNFIGVMKAIGAGNTLLRRVFLLFALRIVVRGLVIGNAVAFALLWMQKTFGIVRLNPETYYMDTVPVLFHTQFIVAVNVATLIVCLLAMLLPSYLVAKIHPAKSIRFE